MVQLITITGKAKEVFKIWDFILAKLGNLTLEQLKQEYGKWRGHSKIS